MPELDKDFWKGFFLIPFWPIAILFGCLCLLMVTWEAMSTLSVRE